MFGFWVHWLTLIMREHGLRYKARKDLQKRNPTKGPSVFVNFVRELQAQLPKEIRRYDTEDTVAQAIFRSRKRFGMDFKFADCLDAELNQRLSSEIKHFRSLSSKS